MARGDRHHHIFISPRIARISGGTCQAGARSRGTPGHRRICMGALSSHVSSLVSHISFNPPLPPFTFSPLLDPSMSLYRVAGRCG